MKVSKERARKIRERLDRAILRDSKKRKSSIEISKIIASLETK